jgi:uncharacterized membrane protein
MSSAAEANDGGARRAVLTGIALVAAALAYEALVHWAVVSGRSVWFGPLLALTPALAGALLLSLRARRPTFLAAWLLAAGLALTLAFAHAPARWANLLYPLPSTAIYLLLLWVFARTLAPGREALVTRLARRVHGSLPDDITSYTRRVTWAWSLFFAAMAAGSVTLFAFASLEAWSLFANVMSLPLIASMFVAEYAYRISRYRDFGHVSLLTAVRAFRDWGRTAVSSQRGG